jgi:hypothetical protein
LYFCCCSVSDFSCSTLQRFNHPIGPTVGTLERKSVVAPRCVRTPGARTGTTPSKRQRPKALEHSITPYFYGVSWFAAGWKRRVARRTFQWVLARKNNPKNSLIFLLAKTS